MITNILKAQFVVMEGRNALLYTASNYREIAVRKWENRNNKKIGSMKIICADISIKDLASE